MNPQSYGPFAYSPINRRPRLQWPNGARVAVWVVPNIEFFPLDELVPGFSPTSSPPDVITWGPRDYGARVGVFRLMDVLAQYDIPATVALNSEVSTPIPRSSRTQCPSIGSSWATASRMPGASITWNPKRSEQHCSQPSIESSKPPGRGREVGSAPASV